jgi:hypothetical protein
MYVPCILYNLLSRPTNTLYICVCVYVGMYINNILYIVSTPKCLDAWIRLPEDDVDASKHVGEPTIIKYC